MTLSRSLALLLASAALPVLAHNHSHSAHSNAQPHEHAAPQNAAPVQNTLSDCLIQEVLPGKNVTAAFFQLQHQGEAQSITAAALPSITPHVELHRMTLNGDVMRMEKLDNYPLQAGENRFARGGNHLMLMDINTPPAVGSEHLLTLTLSDGSTLSCQAVVKTVAEIRATPQGELHHQHHAQPDEHAEHAKHAAPHTP